VSAVQVRLLAHFGFLHCVRFSLRRLFNGRGCWDGIFIAFEIGDGVERGRRRDVSRLYGVSGLGNGVSVPCAKPGNKGATCLAYLVK
jgi:hypothetical protein